jgi:DNA processing protein
MADDDDIRAWLVLLRVPGLGASKLRALLAEAGGDAPAALRRLTRRRSTYRLGDAADAWLAAPDTARIDADLAWLATPGHRLLRGGEADFPPQLETIPQPPAALFVAGDTGLLLRPQIAVVGARNASAGGRANARAFATALAATGLVITSGLAVGIDGVAHVAALDAGAPTVAVMGTGRDVVYPRAHRALAARIASHGALASEFPPGVSALPEHFPRRNRIIAGLTLGTLVIEAGVRSGSLITARLAAEQGREVFALPGSIHNPLARGCHRLIRDGVRLVETVDEVLDALRPLAQALGAGLAARLAEPADPAAAPAATWQADPGYRQLLEALGHDPTALDELVERTDLGPAAVSSMLLMLELDGAVAGLPGGRYQRLP